MTLLQRRLAAPASLAVLAASAPAGARARAQALQLQPGEITYAERPYSPPPVFHAGTELVDLAVVVRGRTGSVVDNLNAADF